VQSIVVGTDGSPSAELAVKRAAEIAKGTGAVLHLVTAYPDVPGYREQIAGSAKVEPIDLRTVAESVLAREARHLEEDGLKIETHASEGDPADVLITVGQEVSADMIVVGARGLTGIQRFLLGSVSSKLSHHSPISVMVVRED
jgi:nucleotide-binding universal stress UspA family protein